MVRHCCIAVLIVLAAACDLGLPARHSGPLVPSLLDLCLVIVCQVCGSAGAVFWAGVTGLLGDAVHLRPIGIGLTLHATVALFWTLIRDRRPQPSGFTGAVLVSLGLLLCLGLFRLAVASLLHPPLTWSAVRITSAQLSITFLVSLLACGMVTLGHRRTLGRG